MSATGNFTKSPAKSWTWLISLDSNYTKKYNYSNDEVDGFHLYSFWGINFCHRVQPVANTLMKLYNNFKPLYKAFFLFLFLSTAHANKEAQNIIDSASEGRRVVEEKALSPIDINKDKEKLFYSETILNWHYALQKENPRGAETIAKTEANLFVKNLKEENLNKDNNLTKAQELVAVKGYCFIREEINVGKQPSSLRLECSTNVG
ncbi:hypothetical protein FDK11_09565, partial [Campylobacter upsaliensis]|nr:hypothetical protein [Campylobacter upsaliensis]